MCLKQSPAKVFFIYTNIVHTHAHAHTILSVPPSRHSHTQADNSVSQRALSLTLWPPLDRGSSWTGTHGCLELTSLGELKEEESLSASENDQLSISMPLYGYVPVSRKA